MWRQNSDFSDMFGCECEEKNMLVTEGEREDDIFFLVCVDSDQKK